MSVATPKPEPAHVSQAFSYAQAAKGRSPSVPTTIIPAKALSEVTDSSPRTNALHEANNLSADPEKPATKRRASEGHTFQSADLKSGGELKPDLTRKIGSSTNTVPSSPEGQSGHQSQSNLSMPSSPDFGTASTSTLPKEDDMFSTPNGSSDSTWDKQSQGSQNGNKSPEKVDTDKESNPPHPWDEDIPTPALLKEAPPPAVNFWQQRALEAKAKVTRQSTAFQPSKSASLSNGNGQTIGASKSMDTPIDVKKAENKKKPKAGPLGGEDRPIVVSTKSNDGRRKSGEEVLEKSVHRAARSPEVEKAMPVAMAPPPPSDAISWPTPESAQDEEKKKAQERGDKGEKEKSLAPRSHGKEKWMPVPYVPTAVFNTPLPPAAKRGGRPARGGREGGGRGGHVTHGSINAERPPAGFQGGSGAVAPVVASECGRAELGSTRGGSNSSKPKRAVSAGPATAREQRRTVESTLTEKRKEEDSGAQKVGQGTRPPSVQQRRTSAATQTESPLAGRPSASQEARDIGQPTRKLSQINTEKDEKYQNFPRDTQAFPRSAGPDRRSEGSVKPPDYGRDFHGYLPSRERGEGRSERGRGSYRGRGGSNNGFSDSNSATGQGFSNGYPSHNAAPGAFPPSKTHSHTERNALQSQGAPFPPPQQHPRAFRGNPRAQSIPNSAGYGRYPAGPSTGPQHLSSIQTDMANMYGYQPGHPGVMSAMPFPTYVEQITLLGMVSMQMEYYFSVDNLCKDMFLRKHMDSQGFVFLSVLAKFNRIKQLTQDMDLIRYVCLNSPNIEFRVGTDGIDRLRKRDGWQQWVLSMEDRDLSARNDGPAQIQQPRALAASYGFDDRQNISPRESLNSIINPADDGSYISTDAVEPSFDSNQATAMTNGDMSDTSISQTPLSAAVPDFAPGLPLMNMHGLSSLESHPHGESSFTDEQVESLMIVVRKSTNPSAPIRAPFHTAASRTFSNGSIDGPTVSEELHRNEELQSSLNTSGDDGPEAFDFNRIPRSRSPFPLGSSARQGNSNAPPVFWVKNKENPIDSLPSDLTHESYSVFRRNALTKREHSAVGSCHRDMDILYQFWSHFLIRNFNPNMYQEFRQIAFEDAAQQESTVGFKNLVQFYDASILGEKIISDEIAQDFVDLVKYEWSGKERLAFDKLRAAWRNGAFNMKNRKKIDNILDPALKAELER